MTAKAFLENSKWSSRPDFLWQTEDNWPQQRADHRELDESKPEVKKVNARVAAVQEDNMHAWQVRTVFFLNTS
jgi:hypothetical protein